MVEQSLSWGQEWVKNSGGSSLIYEEVVWHLIPEIKAQGPLWPLRASVTSATAPASGGQADGSTPTAISAELSISEDCGSPL